uniref:RNA-directed DNA polymerase n=1 Tax=Zeugodacus cucurbitae TaxID=28588 RepID=A0A0A1WYR8_ZEUCU
MNLIELHLVFATLAVFVRYVNYIFQKLINEDIMEMYVDDIVIFWGTEEESLSNMQRILQQAQMYVLEIKWAKCQFLKNRIVFLGHEVEDGCAWPGQGKVKAVKNFPIPKNIRNVQAFLGLTGFRKCIRDYAILARPLTELLKRDTIFQIAETEIRSINYLKSVFTSKPVLQIYKQNANSQLHVDASKHGFGVTLLQLHAGKWHHVFYWSKNTSPQVNLQAS